MLTPSLVQTIATSAYSPPSPDPAGIAYMPAQDRLLISDSEVNEMPLFQGFNLFTATRTGSGVGSGNVNAYSQEPSDLGIDTANGRLFIADDDKDRVFIVSVGARRRLRDRRRHQDQLPHRRPSGATIPKGSPMTRRRGTCSSATASGSRSTTINPVNGVFGDANDIVTHFDVAQYGAGDCEGLGINPALGRLLCVDPSTPDNIYELGKGGALFRVLSMAAIPTSRAVVADVTMAPSSNPNDESGDDELLDRRPAPGQQRLPGRKRRAPVRDASGVRASGDDDQLRPGGRHQRPDAELQLLLIGVRLELRVQARLGLLRGVQLAEHHRAPRRRLAHLLRACHWMRSATSTRRRPPAAFTVRTAEVKVSGSTLVVTAALGAKDNLAIRRPSPSTLRVTDFPSGAYTGSGVHTGAGCTRVGSNAAECSASGITLIQVSSADQTDQVTNFAPLKSLLNGGGANDLLTGGPASDTLIGSTGADEFKGMNGNDELRARDLSSDTTIDCDGGSASGGADKADLDLLPRDSSVSGCETVTRH